MAQKILKIIEYTILFFIFLLFFSSFFFPVYLYPENKFLYNFFIIFIGFLFIASNKLLKEENVIKTPIDDFLFLLFIFYIINIFFSQNKIISLNATTDFFIFLLFYYIIYNYAQKYFNFFIFIIIFISLISTIYGIYQYFWGFNSLLNYINSHSSTPHLNSILEKINSKRVFANFIYPNTFAGFLIFIIPLSLGIFIVEKKFLIYKILAFFIFIMSIINLFLTKSMGGIISIILGIILIISIIHDKHIKRLRLIFLTTIFIIFIPIGFFLIYNRNDILHHLIIKLQTFLRITDLLLKKPFFGYGPGSFELVYNKGIFKYNYLKYAHNVLFQIGIENGLIGITLFIFALFWAYKRILQNFYFLRTEYKKVIVISFLIGITSFLIHNLGDFAIYNFEMSLFFTFTLALLMSQIKIGLMNSFKFKLSYLLGINPGKRRNIIFLFILIILALSTITGGKHPVISSIIGIFAISSFAIWSISKEPIKRFDFDMLLMSIFLLAALSLIYTSYLYNGIKIIGYLFIALIIFYVTTQFLSNIYYKVVIVNYIIFLGVLLSSIILGIFLYNTFFAKNLSTTIFFPNPSLLSGYLVIPFTLILSRILFEKRILFFPLKSFLTILILLVISLIHSKGGILTAFFVFIFLVVLYKKEINKIKDSLNTYKKKEFLLKLIFIFFVLAIFSNILPSSKKILNISGKDPFYFNRLNIFKASIKMIKDKPLYGWGIGSFESIFPKYNFPTKQFARYQMIAKFAHNEFLQIGVELGLMGVILYLILLYFLILTQFPSYEGHKKLWAIKIGSYTAFLSMIFFSTFYFNFHLPGILFTTSVLVAIFIKEKYSIRIIPKEALLFMRIYFFPNLILFFILLSFIVRPALSYYFKIQYNNTKKRSYLNSAIFTFPINPDFYFKLSKIYYENNDYKKSIELLKKSILFDKNNEIYFLNLARNYVKLRDFNKALFYYNTALNLNPYRCFTYYEIANFYFYNLKNFQLFEKFLLKSIEIEPNYLTAMFSLATFYQVKGNYKNALKFYDKIELIENKNLFISTEYEKNMTIYPKNLLFLNKGIIYEKLKKYKYACKYYKKGYKLYNDKNCLTNLNNLCKKEKINECCEK